MPWTKTGYPPGHQRRAQIRCTVQESGSTAARINLGSREHGDSLLNYGLKPIGDKLAETGAASCEPSPS